MFTVSLTCTVVHGKSFPLAGPLVSRAGQVLSRPDKYVPLRNTKDVGSLIGHLMRIIE